MNSGSQKALEKRCPHIHAVSGHFNIVQHFNREDEQARMIKERLSMPTS